MNGTVLILIIVGAVLVVGVVFFLIVRRRQQRAKLLKSLNEYIDGLQEKGRSMMTVGNLGSGFFEKNVDPVLKALSSFAESINSPKAHLDKPDAVWSILSSYAHQLNEAEAAQYAPQPFVNYHPNGKIAMKGHQKEGELHGVIENYYEDGNLQAIRNFENGTLQGKVEFYHPNGKIKERHTRKNGIVHGMVELFSESGKLLERHHRNSGVVEGLLELFYENGQPKRRTQYQQNKKNGLVEIFHENGQLSERYHNVDDLTEGLVEIFHANGQLKEHHHRKNDKIHGRLEAFREDGTMFTKRQYVEGEIHEEEKFNASGKLTAKKQYLPDGIAKIYGYYTNGNLGLEQYAKGDVLHGIQKIYREDGSLNSVCHYVDGKEEGEQRIFNSNGTLRALKYYHNGLKEGTHISYDDEGNITEQVHYRNDQPHGKIERVALKYIYDAVQGEYAEGKRVGLWTYKDENGEIVRTVQYDENGKGRFVGKSQFGDKKDSGACVDSDLWEIQYEGLITTTNLGGVVVREAFYNEDGKQVGEEKNYSDTGTLQNIRYYMAKESIFSELQSEETFHPNGVVASKGAYVEHKKQGVWKFFDEQSNLLREAHYEKGKQAGEERNYSTEGILRNIRHYVAGEYFGELQSEETFHPNGAVASKGAYADGEKQGAWEFFDEQGKLLKVVEYDEGEAKSES